LCFFASPPKNQDRTRKQETKKNKKQETKKKQNKHNTNKNKIANPKGGSSGRELGLVIFCFLFFWIRLAIAEMPSRNCQWLHSIYIAIADVPSRSCQCMCRRTVKKLHSEVFFPLYF